MPSHYLENLITISHCRQKQKLLDVTIRRQTPPNVKLIDLCLHIYNIITFSHNALFTKAGLYHMRKSKDYLKYESNM